MVQSLAWREDLALCFPRCLYTLDSISNNHDASIVHDIIITIYTCTPTIRIHVYTGMHMLQCPILPHLLCVHQLHFSYWLQALLLCANSVADFAQKICGNVTDLVVMSGWISPSTDGYKVC